MSSFQERKKIRKKYYESNIKGWKLRTCTACSGSGYYDNCDQKGNPTKCNNCNGTGKERYKGNNNYENSMEKRKLK